MKELYPYTPRKTNHERLERYFVARNDLLEELLASLQQQAKAKSLQHWMILGSRGLGKSHLAALLYHRIKNTPALQAKWIPLLMDEEEPEVFSLPTLLARIVAVLGEELRAVAPEKANEVLNFLDHLRQGTLSSDHLYEDIIAYLKDFTNLNKKRIVVFLENTDDLFTKSIKSDLEIKKLRHLLLQHNFLLFIATSPTFFERIGKQKEPLYGLFRLRHLELLDFEQSMDLMRRWAEEAKNGEMLARLRRPDFRIRVLNHLTGGNPRLLLFLYLTLSSQKEMESAAEAFGKLLEHDLTGFYLSRMRDIPEQAKPIVVALAKSRINLTQKEIAERTFLPIRSMGTHINRLEKSGLVRAFTKKAGKNTLYGLADHLFRLWHQWRTGWREREVIQALVEFLAIWYRERELDSLADGKGMSAWYARQALEYRHEKEFRSKLELIRKEGMADLTEHLQKGDYQGIFYLVESLSDFGLDLKPWIAELEKEMFYRGPEELHMKLLAQWENQQMEMAEEPQEGDREKPLQDRIRQLGALVESAKGRAILDIPIREIEDGGLVVLVGRFKFKDRDFSGAEEAYQHAVDLNPEKFNAWYFLGRARIAQDNHTGAEEALQRAVELNSVEVSAWYFLGWTRFNQDNHTGAEEALYRAVELNPEDFNAWLLLGMTRGDQDNHTGAEEALQRAVELNPEDFNAWLLLGIARGDQDKHNGAEEALQRAVELNTENFNAWLLLGIARGYQDKHTGAEEALQRAVELNTENFNAWLLLGITCGEQDNFASAEEALQRAVELDPDNSRALYFLGRARGNQSNHAGAVEALQRAVELKPDDFDSWYLLGRARDNQGNHTGAEEALQHAVELDPKKVDAWFLLGRTRIDQGNHASAEEALQRAVEVNPESYNPLLLLGIVRGIRGNYQEAEEVLRRIVTINKDSFEGWYLLGLACYEQWKLKKSYEAMLKAIEINPEHTKAYANLMELHVRSQGRLDALKRLDRSLKLKKIEAYVRAALHLFRAIALTSEENKPAAIQALKNGQKWIDKLDPNIQAEQRQSILAALMDSLRDLILPETWKVVNNYLTLMSGSAPKVHEVIGRLEHVVQYYKELEFEPGEKAVRRDKAAARAQRILDRLPTEERGPIEEMVKEVGKNIKSWRKVPKTARASKRKLSM